LGGGFLVEEFAEVEEMFVGGAALGEGCALPYFDELLGCHQR
jgi:hypothetical protein